MSRKLFILFGIVCIGGIPLFLYSIIGDWTLIAKLFAFQLGVALIAIGLLAGLVAIIRSVALGRLNVYVQRLNKAGYDAPKIDGFETKLFTISLLFATVMLPGSIWLWYEIYTKSAFILLLYVVFTTSAGIWGIWSSIYTWKSVSIRLKQYCDRLNDGVPLSLPRLPK